MTDYAKLSMSEKVDYWLGRIAMAIGNKGQEGVRSVIWAILNTEHTEAYNRGRKEGITIERDRAKSRRKKSSRPP